MSIIVFWLEGKEPKCRELGDLELLGALALAEQQRKAGHHHVVISTADPNSVGKPGVSDVLPEGYDWKKRRV